MKPVKFEGHTVIIAEDQEGVRPLPAAVNDEYTVSCWELSNEEIAQLTRTKKMWVSVRNIQRPLFPFYLTVKESEVLIAPMKVATHTLNVDEEDHPTISILLKNAVDKPWEDINQCCINFLASMDIRKYSLVGRYIDDNNEPTITYRYK